jgi:hypothetical protein
MFFALLVAATPYIILPAEVGAKGNYNWTIACAQVATTWHLDPLLTYPLVAGSPIISNWDVTKDIYRLSGEYVGTAAAFKANAGLTATMYEEGMSGGPFYSGLRTNFELGQNCSGWTTQIGTATVGNPDLLTGFLDSEGDLSCSVFRAVVCIYTGGTQTPTTFAPSNTPTTPQPSLTPTTSQPSKTPTTSQPSKTPTTSQPSKTPTTSSPSKTPTTSHPSSSPVTLPPTISTFSTMPTTIAIGSSMSIFVVLGIVVFLVL